MTANDVQGRFQAIDSFAIRTREEFYVIGQLLEGEVQPHWFMNIQLNPSFAMTAEIKQVDTVEMAGEATSYLLLVVAADSQDIDILLGLNIGSEAMNITATGQK